MPGCEHGRAVHAGGNRVSQGVVGPDLLCAGRCTGCGLGQGNCVGLEEGESWAAQVFVRVADVEFSIGADSDMESDLIHLRGTHLPSGDVDRLEDVFAAHFGAA